MIAAIVLAAGLSRRMGCFKLLLPWGATTVLGRVVATLEAAGVEQIVVVTGYRADEIAAALMGTGARTAVNPDYASGEMLSSIRTGIRALAPPGLQDPSGLPPAALLCLGDQPQMEVATVQRVLETAGQLGWTRTVIPSYRMRAGHPILLPRGLWPEILECSDTLRTVLAAHRDQTHYLAVDTPTILADLDTPEDYAAGSWKQKAGSHS